MIEHNKIYCRDCVEGMKEIGDNSIDLTVTSPPYDNLREYKGYTFNFEATAKELYRITKPGGVVVWVVGDATINGSETGTSFKQALYFKEIGCNLHDTMIYEKENYVPLTHNRYEQAYEFMFVLSKGKPKTFNPIMIPTKEMRAHNKTTVACASQKQGGSMSGSRLSHRIECQRTKQHSNIFKYKVGINNSSKDAYIFDHPATFPEQLANDHIISWSNKGDLVFDPFSGSGTTGKMAILNERKFIGFEISEEYCNIANKRISDVLMQEKIEAWF